jgi:hypothetical protein
MRPTRIPALSCIALCVVATNVNAFELYKDEESVLNADVKLGLGIYTTERNYIGRDGRTNWQEAYGKYGLSGSKDKVGGGSLYGTFNLISSGTWGDGDPGGISNGTERRTAAEEAFIGWKSGDSIPALGKDGVDFSVGRQVVKFGSGFLLNDDGVNPGRGFEEGRYDRGGAYYLGPRLAFGKTAVLKLGGAEGWHGSVAWLKSDTHLQANTEFAAGTIEHTLPQGTIGLTFLRGLGVDDRYAIVPSRLERKGMNVYSIRADGNAGIENADFAIEFARQRNLAGVQTAGYAEAAYTFADASWRPQLSYRYTRYSKDWDFWFQGGFRMRYQGEIASNYAFSYNFNSQIHDVALTVRPTEALTVTAMLFDFRTLKDRDTENLDARELAVYVDWAVTENIMISPIVGVYKPKKFDGNGGNQSGSASANVYGKLVLSATY